MPWMPGIPHDQGACPQGTITPLGVVAHRTYGSWEGDYAVGAGSNPPVGFHFLIGKKQGRWVQFYDTTTRCAHGGSNSNANDVSVGIEVEGRNDDPMTDWQLSAVAEIVVWLEQTHSIAPVYRFSSAHDMTADHGYIPHSAVRGSDHSDFWTVEDWNRVLDQVPVPEPSPPITAGDPDMILVKRQAGDIHLVGVAQPVGIANTTDLKEIRRALQEPGYEANISEATWENLAKITQGS